MSIISTLKEQIAGIGDDLRSKINRVEKLKQEREDLQTAPLTKGELVAGVLARIDAAGKEYPERLARALTGTRHKPGFNFKESQIDLLTTTGGASTANNLPPANFAWFCADLIKERIRAAIDDPAFAEVWGGFDDVGPPAVERERRLKTINKEIEALEKEIADIRHDTEEAFSRIRS